MSHVELNRKTVSATLFENSYPRTEDQPEAEMEIENKCQCSSKWRHLLISDVKLAPSDIVELP